MTLLTVSPAGVHAVVLAVGDRITVIDIEGGQGGDLWAFCSSDTSEYHSAPHTRVATSRLFPRVGEAFVTNHRRPILRLVEDTLPLGTHDMLVAACDPSRYAGLGVKGWHASCEENLLTSMAAIGRPNVEVPQPINVMANFPVHMDGTFEMLAGVSRPGDRIGFELLLDAIVVFSNCPQDIIVINNRHLTPMSLEIQRA